ncbi:hypothetical protein [Rhodococcus sp. NPDC056516]|uniref:hypothetical protein n=1 Tax=Rhodococcus sp. NPDC056516 TaxID=3345847 RepID=UPI00366DA050
MSSDHDEKALGVWDTGSNGIESDAPALLHPVQSVGWVYVMVTNPADFVGDWAPALLEVGQAFRLTSDPSSVLDGGPGITLFKRLAHGHWSSVAAVDPGFASWLESAPAFRLRILRFM